MNGLVREPLFLVLLSFAAFECGVIIRQRTGKELFHPLLTGIAIVVAVLSAAGISYGEYSAGGNIISFFLGPATVALAVPRYRQYENLRENLVPVAAGVSCGSVFSMFLMIAGGRLLGLDREIILSLVPKSITTPIAMEVSAAVGGIPSLTVLAVVITGISGAVTAPYVMKICRVNDRIACGTGIGTSAHAVGTSKAMEMGEVQGAFSSLSIGLAGLFTAAVAPLAVLFFL